MPKSHRLFSWFKKPRGPSEPPDDRSQVSTGTARSLGLPLRMTERTTKTGTAAPQDCTLVPLLLQRPLSHFLVAPYKIMPRSNGHLFETSYLGHFGEVPVPLLVVSNNQAHPNPNILCRLFPSRHPQTNHAILSPPTEVNTDFPRVMGNALATDNDYPSIHTQQEPGSKRSSAPPNYFSKLRPLVSSSSRSLILIRSQTRF
ncbi:uncharacterized protein EI90DRAFT_1754464 [Cantharellus anzutake]|uniref:uncharacterized protein n=1 Tax=Cantharellus anzutake TaxID=1750568 RepID=UPI0019036D18|nr:uncharacterized protein EI90DRAFT_1754464 [Cantharellus anzutake]KAF8341562.1 hypothetical protein EI90DRAFT_1754464 [Cantharellus anzutake]